MEAGALTKTMQTCRSWERGEAGSRDLLLTSATPYRSQSAAQAVCAFDATFAKSLWPLVGMQVHLPKVHLNFVYPDHRVKVTQAKMARTRMARL